jgi:hypothetical protein
MIIGFEALMQLNFITGEPDCHSDNIPGDKEVDKPPP